MPPTPVEGVGFQRSRWSVRVCDAVVAGRVECSATLGNLSAN
jgi:hypothetical protein